MLEIEKFLTSEFATLIRKMQSNLSAEFLQSHADLIMKSSDGFYYFDESLKFEPNYGPDIPKIADPTYLSDAEKQWRFSYCRLIKGHFSVPNFGQFNGFRFYTSFTKNIDTSGKYGIQGWVHENLGATWLISIFRDNQGKKFYLPTPVIPPYMQNSVPFLIKDKSVLAFSDLYFIPPNNPSSKIIFYIQNVLLQGDVIVGDPTSYDMRMEFPFPPQCPNGVFKPGW